MCHKEKDIEASKPVFLYTDTDTIDCHNHCTVWLHFNKYSGNLILPHLISLTQLCSWLTMTAWWQHAVSKPGTLSMSQEGCCLEARGQASLQNYYGLPDRFSSTLSPVINSALTLSVEHLACQKYYHINIPKSLLYFWEAALPRVATENNNNIAITRTMFMVLSS